MRQWAQWISSRAENSAIWKRSTATTTRIPTGNYMPVVDWICRINSGFNCEMNNTVSGIRVHWCFWCLKWGQGACGTGKSGGNEKKSPLEVIQLPWQIWSVSCSEQSDQYHNLHNLIYIRLYIVSSTLCSTISKHSKIINIDRTR